MCNACGFLCCGSDLLTRCGCDSCGCDSCGEPDCAERCDGCGDHLEWCRCDEDEYPEDDLEDHEGTT